MQEDLRKECRIDLKDNAAEVLHLCCFDRVLNYQIQYFAYESANAEAYLIAVFVFCNLVIFEFRDI